MTFASETTRFLFHQLPIEKQLIYIEWEKKLSIKNQLIQIDSVMNHENILEVVVRITDNFE